MAIWTLTFTPTGSPQTWIVPKHDAGTLRITCKGGSGDRSAHHPNPAGGLGGSIRAYLTVAPGTLLTIVPGYYGLTAPSPTGHEGGIGGIVPMRGRGGMASLVELPSGLVMIAGGGGGSGRQGSGGGTGGTGGLGIAAGSDGRPGTTYNGKGGTTSAAGAAGSVGGTGTLPQPGVGGVGGRGGNWFDANVATGGGGGGGYYGGGGGGFNLTSVGAGGGGGSSWGDTGVLSSIDNTGGNNSDDGSVIIEWDGDEFWVPGGGIYMDGRLHLS